MRPDLPYLYHHFDRFNKLCYDGKLPVPEIRLNRRRRSLGLTCQRRDRRTGNLVIWIEISVLFDMPESEYLDTLLHEMIHYYIFFNGKKDTSSHGSIFRSEMERLKRDYNLTVTISKKRSEDDEMEGPREVRYFCVSTGYRGENYITVAAKTTIFTLWYQFPDVFMITSHKWYVGNHPELGMFPRSRTLKLYHIDKQRLDKILAESRELERIGHIIRVKK